MNGRFDLGQRREAPAREASDRPAVRRDAQVSAASSLEEGVRQCCVEFSSLRQPQPCCWSPSLPTMPKLAVAEVAAIGAVAEPTAAALSQFEDLGAAALSQCAAGE